MLTFRVLSDFWCEVKRQEDRVETIVSNLSNQVDCQRCCVQTGLTVKDFAFEMMHPSTDAPS